MGVLAQQKSNSDRRDLAWLDLARGLAALAVCAGHLRALLLVNFIHAGKLNPLTNAFYFLTGFGHEAVIVFFVLSGFLVGGGALDRMKANCFNWTDYAVTRLSRLWTVLAPALLLTVAWDYAGLMWGDRSLYQGAQASALMVGPRPGEFTASFTPLGFLANLVFLQTIAAPPFGTNQPLWSLANEFWYYAIFPCAAAVIQARRVRARIIAFVAAGAIVLVLPAGLVLYGLVWLMGVAAHQIRPILAGRPRLTVAAMGVGATAFGLALTACRLQLLHNSIIDDFLVGLSFASLLPALALIREPPSVIARPATVLASFSYTLYAVHFPMLFCLSAVILRGSRLPPDLGGFLCFAALLATAIAYAWLLYWFFERRTPAIRSWARTVLSRIRPSPVVAS